MRRQRDTIGNRLWLGLIGVSALALVSGCGWFDDSAPAGSQKVRPGVDRQAPASSALPPPSGAGQQHDSGIVPADPVGTPQIGSIVPGKGGQKTQKEAAEKEAAERDAKEREARDKREAEERDAKAKEPPPEPIKATPVAGVVPSMPAAAKRGDEEGPATTVGPTSGPPATTAPPPAPVTSAPVAPPPAPTPAPDQPAAPPRT
jgi:hypothetical protein